VDWSALRDLGLPVVVAFFLWWFLTGVILMLDGLPRRGMRWSMGAATLIALLALAGLARTADADSAGTAYCAFVCALLVWGWQELAFLAGWLTGPRKHGCAPGCGGGAHFVHAVQAILYHELGILLSGAAVVAVTWGGTNQIGTWTYLVLWAMRTSAKLNLFLGVRNSGEEFLPPHLAYLTSFFRHRAMNLLFPISVTAATVAAALLGSAALDPAASRGEAIGLALVTALLALAILEHWMMVLPVRGAAPWEWAMRVQRRWLAARERGDRTLRLDAPVVREAPPAAPVGAP
jgi:putative photosynthetic complex assembly protein 2